ncbi:hypothetical protein LOK49_LG04G03596 [Camellia lanceoleosa]|uniref:Uncharacterized protein n=1 Tax=Camellia lanceoleosa TaxID=1840588 RepID=A0ACC0HXF9_9ERIC|nr:hypothetical protein LOK49_LG04G03596 [Camellia lanceoleosa]
MASIAKFSYHRLRHEGGFDDEDDEDRIRERVIGRAKSWSRFRKVHTRKRLRIRIPILNRFLKRKARQVMVSWTKVLKRLKESQSHFGDLFAGNYLFLQVTPTPLKCVDRSLKAHHHHHHHHHDLHGLSSTSRYSVQRIGQ